MNSFGLDNRERNLIASVFHEHPEIDEVRIFGSRAKGNYEKHSDIDLAFWGNVSWQLLARLAGEIDQLPLPYTFDLAIYDAIRNRRLREHIDRVGTRLYKRKFSPPCFD